MSGDTAKKLDLSDANDFSQSEEEEEQSHARTSEDVRRHDQETLTAEEEAERLLGSKGEESRTIGQRFTDRREARQQRRREKRLQRRSKKYGDTRELLYDTEKGRRSSSESSSASDLQRLKETQAQQKRTSKGSRFARFTLIHIVIIGAFVALLYGAYRATTHRAGGKATIAQKLSNGTHTFLPTTLLISLDGFRADFLTRGLTPTLNGFIREGVSPKYMTPVFPSLTFPNHFTLVTGVYPESHGVVGNTFWDPSTSKEFYYTDPDRSLQPEWWNAEPIWLTAELADVRTAIHMWPGSEAHIGSMEPTYVDEFNGDEKLEKKVDRIFGWLDLPGPEDEGADEKNPRPQLIAAYVPDVDRDGHQSGPNSTHIRGTIQSVDKMLGDIFRKIDERNLTEIVNIIVVSDHGMATTSINRLIQLEDLIDTKLIEHTDGWPLYGLRPYKNDPAHLEGLYDQLITKSQLPQYRNTFDVYLRDKNMPARYHFSANHRIAPLWIVPRTGWAIVTRDEFDIPLAKQNGDEYKPRGLHGYDFEHPLMRAIFVARGPAFPHPKGSRIKEFANLEVYNIVCDSLGLEPKPNNGTLRLPLRTQGLHNFLPGNSLDIEIPEDLSSEYDEMSDLGNLNFGVPPVMPSKPLPPVEPATPSPPTQPFSPAVPGQPTASSELDRPVVHDEDKEPDTLSAWWEWIKSKVEEIKWWAVEAMGGEAEEMHESPNGTAANETDVEPVIIVLEPVDDGK